MPINPYGGHYFVDREGVGWSVWAATGREKEKTNTNSTAKTPYRFTIFLKIKESGIALIPFSPKEERGARRQVFQLMV